jgi:hypothetical protein
MFRAMPEGFKMTHEDIGNGLPSLVFIYDPNLAVSITQPEQMNIVRNQVGDQANFLIAKRATPEGDKLIREHNAKSAEVLLFDGAGKLIKRQFAQRSANELIQWLESAKP